MQAPKDQAEFDHLVFAAARQVPAGKVTTYGRIARMLTPPRDTDIIAYSRIGPRWVGYALARCPDDVPWHRVVNAKGRISPRLESDLELQKRLLEDEGVHVSQDGRIDLEKYLWRIDEGPKEATPEKDR
jgi:methylated-DNA-protein-cysteine methyltransferase-like protein